MDSSTNTDFLPSGLPTLVGSLPLRNQEEALDLMLKYVPDIPVWIQLPINPEEGLISQFIEGLPGLVQTGDRIYFDTSSDQFESQLLSFYEDYLAISEGGVPLTGSRFAFGATRGRGLEAFIDRVCAMQKKPVAVKGQVTGPFTFLTATCDQNKKNIFYDERLKDAVIKALALKAQWQTERLKTIGVPVLVSIDEPALAGYGSSALISIGRAEVINMLREVKDAINKAGGLAGVHVCANTDWSLLTESGINIISFDAYNYFDRLILYRKEIIEFLNNGNILASGIVPTSDARDIYRESAESLAEKWLSQAQQLLPDHLPLLKQSIITPSCGTGALSPELSERVLKLTKEVSDILRCRADLK